MVCHALGSLDPLPSRECRADVPDVCAPARGLLVGHCQRGVRDDSRCPSGLAVAACGTRCDCPGARLVRGAGDGEPLVGGHLHLPRIPGGAALQRDSLAAGHSLWGDRRRDSHAGGSRRVLRLLHLHGTVQDQSRISQSRGELRNVLHRRDGSLARLEVA